MRLALSTAMEVPDADDIDLSSVSTDVAAVAERATKAGWEISWTRLPDNELMLAVLVPNGRSKRRLTVGQIRAKRLAEVSFEHWRVLADYLAINNSATDYIEALLRVNPSAPLLSIPGIEAIETSPTGDSGSDSSEESIEAGTVPPSVRASDQWRLKIVDDKHPWSVEISGMSDEFLGLVSDPVARFSGSYRRSTLKIYGVDAPLHDDAVHRLEDIAGAFLFDLDLRYGVSLSLAQHSQRPSLRSQVSDPMRSPPSLPRMRYASEPLSLYNYGRSASGMPLLQFLAYYQVLEFFFPMYFRQDVVRRLRQEIASPRFDVSDDAQIARLSALAASGGHSGYGNERDQLKATVVGCTDELTLSDFLNASPGRAQCLADKKRIKNVPVINADSRNSTLLDQIVSRVYALRCRIVHAKADGGEMAADLLLPGSSEAAALEHDIAVLQFLAQKAIVASGSPLY